MSKPQLYVAGQFALLGVLAVALVVFPPGQYLVLRLIGLALILVGFVVLALALREFAVRNRTIPNITPTPTSAAALVESGVYSRIRHPIYTGVLLAVFGAALAHGHFVIMLLALVVLAFLTMKSHYEESMLRTVYPQYGDYMTHTGRFLPFL